MRAFGRLVGVFAVAFLTASAQAQVFYTLLSPNPESAGYFGSSVSGTGDVNNDGYSDVVAGAEREDGGATNAGRAYVFSGATGAPLYILLSPNSESAGYFGSSVSGAGDVNADGYSDVVVGAKREDGGAGNAGRAYVFSGATGAPLYTLLSPNPESSGYFGSSVSGAGDVNADGYSDVVIGARYEDGGTGNAGRAYVFSGATGAPLYTLLSPNPESAGSFGSSVSGAGDVNDDGYSDVMVGARYEDGGAASAGRAYVFSGATGAPLYTLLSPNPQSAGYFGSSVSGAGDVNNDGYSDVIVGAYQEDGGAEFAGRAYVFSGATGAPLYTLLSPNPQSAGYFGSSVSGVGDVNNDGYSDVIVGAYQEDGGAEFAGRAYVFSGATGAPLYTLLSPNPQSAGYFGSSVSGAGDVNNDGYSDVVAGAYQEDGGAGNAGRAYIFNPGVNLWGEIVGGELVLNWPPWPAAVAFWVHGVENQPWFEPTLGNRLAVLPSESTTWSSSNGIGDDTENWIYLVVAMDAGNAEIHRFNSFAEFDFGAEIP